MRSIKTIEDRIVSLEKITSDGVSSKEEAELRQIDMTGMEPKQISVVLAREFGVSLTMDWSSTNQRFSTTLGGVTFYSDFNYKDFLQDPLENKQARSSRRK